MADFSKGNFLKICFLLLCFNKGQYFKFPFLIPMHPIIKPDLISSPTKKPKIEYFIEYTLIHTHTHAEINAHTGVYIERGDDEVQEKSE